MKRFGGFLGLAALLLLTACAPRAAVKDSAPAALSDPLRLMRLAMYQHLTGDWAASNGHLERCLSILEKRPDIKLGQEAGALLFTQGLREQSGDPEELVFLHTLGMVNYAMLGQVSEAMVEARRSDELQRWMVDQGKAVSDDPLARILSAKLYEGQGQRDDARIDLERAKAAYAAITPPVKEPSFLEQDLARLGRAPNRAERARKMGEVWVLVYAGKLSVEGGKVTADGLVDQGRLYSADGSEAPLELVQDLTPLKGQAMKARALGETLRSFGRVAVRSALILALAMLTDGHLPDESGAFIADGGKRDFSHWDNLPAQVYAARLFLKPGLQTVHLEAQVGGVPRALSATVRVPAGRTTLLQGSFQGIADTLLSSRSLQP